VVYFFLAKAKQPHALPKVAITLRGTIPQLEASWSTGPVLSKVYRVGIIGVVCVAQPW